MAVNQSLVTHGTVGGTPINVDMSRIDHSTPVKVRLSSAYTTATRSPGIPTRPGFTGAPYASLDTPKTYAINTVMTVHAAEAAALVAAGVASYV